MGPTETTGALLEERSEARRVLVALRLGVAVAVVVVLLQDPPWRYGHLPDSAMVDTLGAELIRWLPTSSPVVAAGAGVLVIACVLVAMGRGVRMAGTVALLTGIWVLGVPQLFSPPNHYHHVIWLMVIVVLSGGRRQTGVDPEWWVRAALLLVGLAYLFPGVAKARMLPGWVTGDALHGMILRSRWDRDMSYGFIPDPFVSHWLAAALIVFEILFIVVAQTRFRRAAIVCACSFHILAGLTAGIWFVPMLAVLIPFLVGRPTVPDPARLPRLPSAAIAVALIGVVAAFGGMGALHAWPIAAYPPFDHEPSGQAVRVVAVVDGEQRSPGEILLPAAPSARRTKFELSHRDEQLSDLLEAHLERPVVVYREIVDVGRG